MNSTTEQFPKRSEVWFPEWGSRVQPRIEARDNGCPFYAFADMNGMDVYRVSNCDKVCCVGELVDDRQETTR